MTATRITILALGLMFLSWTAARADGVASVPAVAPAAGPAGVATCSANCQAGVACTDGSNCGGPHGLLPTDFTHDPGCRYADNPGEAERDPIFSEFKPEWDDLCERCNSCTYRIDATALCLIRSNPDSVTLLSNVTDGSTLVDANQFQYSYHVGPRLAMVITDCEGWGFEANFFGLDSWSSSHDFNNNMLPGGLANLTVDSVITEPLLNARISIASMLYSSELNVRKTLCNNLDFVTGFRWIDMHDRYYAAGTSVVTGNPVVEQIETRNHLFGSQIGLDGSVGPGSGNWKIGGFIKGGCELNNGTEHTSLSDAGNLGDLSASDNEIHASFFGEAGLTAYIQLDKHLSVSAGYQVMYITSTAQPVDQIAQTDLIGGSSFINFNSGIFYHGATLGAEVSW